MSPRGRPLVAVGIILVASGLFHLAVWALLGGPWEGPVTWRKPILFGISGGLTALSLGWAWERLPWRRGDGWLAMGTAAALFVEVALIDLQCYRGLASHFNRQTPFDSFLYDLMGVLIVGVSLVSLDLTVRFFREPVAMPADMLLAARAGLVFLVISCGLGIWASVHGEWRQQAGLAPEQFGAAGVTKFPHGAVIHALQWLPAFAWAARRAGIRARRRVWLVAIATVGTACLGLYSLGQTLAGRARFDTTPPTAILLVAGLVGLAYPVAEIVAAVFRGRSSRGESVRPGSSRPGGPTAARPARP
jgi:hypothetical protein